jgi:hypothetical protein
MLLKRGSQRVAAQWDRKGNDGINRIAGGTGKYRGITGSGPWKCWDPTPGGAFHCTQRFDYQLKAKRAAMVMALSAQELGRKGLQSQKGTPL